MKVEYHEADEACALYVEANCLPLDKYSGSDFFRAFCRVRSDLADHEIFPAVYASHEDVYPGGLLSDSSNGLIAYQFIGDGPPVAVEIFSTVKPSEYSKLSSVDEQKDRRRKAIRGGRIRPV